MSVEVTIKGDVEVLCLEPEDQVVVTFDYRLNGEEGEAVYDGLKGLFPANRVTIINGAKLEIVRADPA